MKQLIIHDPAEIGNKLLHARKAQGLTRKDLMMITGISETPILRVESGQGNPNIDTLKLWAGALGYDVIIIHTKKKKAHWIVHDRPTLKFGCSCCGSLFNNNGPVCPTCKAEMEVMKNENNKM